MRLMTTAAIYCRSIDVKMRAAERVIGQIMTFPAELMDRFVQQLASIRHVAAMAPQAIPAGGRMHPLGIHSFLDLLVAGETESRAFGQQQAL